MAAMHIILFYNFYTGWVVHYWCLVICNFVIFDWSCPRDSESLMPEWSGGCGLDWRNRPWDCRMVGGGVLTTLLDLPPGNPGPMDEIGEMVGLPKTWVKLEDSLYHWHSPICEGNLGIWVSLTDDDVIPLVASSAGLPGFLGGGDPILPISLLYRSVYNLSTSKGWDIPFRGEGANDVFSCLLSE